MRNMKNLMKVMIVGAGVFAASEVVAHPDGMKPYWYPSSWVYGFIEGCWESIEQSQVPIMEELWPVQIKAACGCVVDALRHSVTFSEVEANYDSPEIQSIVTATLPICVGEQKGSLENYSKLLR